jgi:hypothetical protein
VKESKLEEQKQGLDKNFKTMSNTSFVNTKSKELNEQFNSKIFKKIFEILTEGDESENPTIDKFTDYTRLNEKVKNTLYPLYVELEEQNEDLNMDEFVLACKQLHGFLTTEEKGGLISWYNSILKKVEANNFTFKVY